MLIIRAIPLLPVLTRLDWKERRTIAYTLGYEICLLLMFGLLRADLPALTSWIMD